MKKNVFYAILFALSAYLCFLAACGNGEIVDISKQGSPEWAEINKTLENLVDGNSLIAKCQDPEQMENTDCPSVPSVYSSAEEDEESSSSEDPEDENGESSSSEDPEDENGDSSSSFDEDNNQSSDDGDENGLPTENGESSSSETENDFSSGSNDSSSSNDNPSSSSSSNSSSLTSSSSIANSSSSSVSAPTITCVVSKTTVTQGENIPAPTITCSDGSSTNKSSASFTGGTPTEVNNWLTNGNAYYGASVTGSQAISVSNILCGNTAVSGTTSCGNINVSRPTCSVNETSYETGEQITVTVNCGNATTGNSYTISGSGSGWNSSSNSYSQAGNNRTIRLASATCDSHNLSYSTTNNTLSCGSVNIVAASNSSSSTPAQSSSSSLTSSSSIASSSSSSSGDGTCTAIVPDNGSGTMCLWSSGDCWPIGNDRANCASNGWIFVGGTQGYGELCSGGTFTCTGKNLTPPTEVGTSVGCCNWENKGCFAIFEDEIDECKSSGYDLYDTCLNDEAGTCNGTKISY